MEKIQELLKEGKLAKSLMEDKEFVDGAKEIFKAEKIDIDDKGLAELMDEIEDGIRKSNILDSKVLEEVSGGVSGKGAARFAVKTITTIVGVALSGIAVSKVGVAAGMIPAAIRTVYGNKLDKSMSFKEQVNLLADKALLDPGLDTGMLVGRVSGFGLGAIGGGYFANKLGDYICKKLGLE